jgi:hypothetical protein
MIASTRASLIAKYWRSDPMFTPAASVAALGDVIDDGISGLARKH